jgi:hypothetical protein
MSTKKIIITTVVTIATAVTICLGTNWYLNRQSNSTPKAPHQAGSPAEPSTPQTPHPTGSPAEPITPQTPHPAGSPAEPSTPNGAQPQQLDPSQTFDAAKKREQDAYEAMRKANAQVSEYMIDIHIGLPAEKKLAEAKKEQTKAENEKAEAERNFDEAHKNYEEAFEKYV